jgi:hypothetical protein
MVTMKTLGYLPLTSPALNSLLTFIEPWTALPQGGMMIGSTVRLPCVDMPCIDIPRLGSTVVSTYSIAMSPTSQCVMPPHATNPIAMSPTSQHVMATARHVSTSHHSIQRARNTCDFSSQFKYSPVIFQITLDGPLIDISL